MPEKYDVIIIGAGIGGLTAAAILARNGKKVLVLEKNPVPGGYAVNFRRGSFIFDAAIHILNGCTKGTPIYNILEKTGIASKVNFLKPKYLYRSIFPDFDLRIPQNNPFNFIDILSEYFPDYNQNLTELFNTMSCVSNDVNRFFGSFISWKFEKLLFPLKYPNLFHYINKPYEYMLDKYLKRNEKLKAIISQLWIYLGLPPSKLSAFFYSCAWHDYFWNGGFYPKGGGYSLSLTLTDETKKHSGEILFNSEVKGIVIENNRALGVECNDGQIFWGQNVISNMDAKKTFYNLVKKSSDLIEKIRKEIAFMEPSMSAFQVYLGMDSEIEKVNSEDYEIFVNHSYNTNSHYFASLNNDMNNTLLVITLYYNLENQSNYTVCLASLSDFDFWNKLSKQEYEFKKKEFSDILIKRAEKIIPGLVNFIRIKETATPLTMQRYTNNEKGAIYGWSQKLSQSGIKRFSQKSKINNLYLASAWTYPGGGIAGVLYAGEQVARKILWGDK